MACKYICDGCGKEQKSDIYPNGAPGHHKPYKWYQRQDKDGIQDACSRECVDKIAATTGKTGVITLI